MNTTNVIVKTSKEYVVHVGPGLMNDCGKILAKLIKPCKVGIISDSNVAPLYLNTVSESLSSAGFTSVSFAFPAGEESKNVSTISSIWEFLAENEITRSDCLLALGGGVVGDITGFAAASFLRGIPFIQVPTSLLAAVDSSVGGKTAIDLKAGKNLAGAFLQPLTVICDTNAISTLPQKFLVDGTAEVIKYGLLGNKKILKIYEDLSVPYTYENIKDFLPEIITESVKMKADFVIRDEFDNGDRKFLNLGHTIGHSIEQCANFKVSHGYGVAAGMALIAKAGEKLGHTEPGTYNYICNLLNKVGLPTGIPDNLSFTKEELLAPAAKDKKRNGKKLTLVMPERKDKCSLLEINADELSNYIIL